MLIAIDEIEAKLDKKASIEDRLKQAMKLALNHWLITDEDQQFRCAVGAVLLTASEEEKAVINEELKFLRTLGSAIDGVPVNSEAMLMGMSKKSYGLISLWRAVKKEEKK
jgi:hypothetical protein